MKKIIVIIAIMIIIMLIPISIRRLKDGGSVEYKAILYKITKIHRLNEQSEDGYERGWVINILGIQVYNKTNIEINSGKEVLEVKVVDIGKDSMLVEVTKDTEGFTKGNQVSVNISKIKTNIKKKINIDSQIKITFNGNVNVSYPPQICADKIELK